MIIEVDMSLKIEEQLGKKQGDDSIVYRATAYNPETKELSIFIEKIGDSRWCNYLDEGETYIFNCHDEKPIHEGTDSLELWELPTEQKKWVNESHITVGDLVLPQILIYFWHNDNKLSMEWDW